MSFQVESPVTNAGITSSGGSWALLEYQLPEKPSRLVRQDGKRPDSRTYINPVGKSLVWDVTVISSRTWARCSNWCVDSGRKRS